MALYYDISNINTQLIQLSYTAHRWDVNFIRGCFKTMFQGREY